MNILFLANHLNIGGITSYLFTLGRGLKSRGHNIYIACAEGEMLPRFLEEGIIHLSVPLRTKKEISPKIIYSVFKLKGEIRKNGIEIIHSHSRTTQVLGSLLSRATGAHYLSTCHGFFKPRFLRRIFPCWGQQVIAISEQVKGHLIRDFKIDEKLITVIHNGIDIESFQNYAFQNKEKLKRKFGLQGKPVVGIIARLSDVKGHAYLIQAMKMVLEKQPQAQLFIVGEGKEKERLIKLAKGLKIEENVVFHPSVSDTREALSVIDLFVMPSLKEGLGLAIMEAMASGKAVIGSNIGGIKSLIRDDFNGVLVEPANAQALADAISSLLSDEKKLEFFSRNAVNFIRDNFSIGAMIAQTERVYLECINQRN